MNRLFLPVALMCVMLPAPASSDDVASLSEMFRQGSNHFGLRYRYEWVDQDGFADDARASTLRTRLSHQTAAWNGWSAMLEAEDIREVGVDDFNAGGGTTPNRVGFPVVADPETTEINQAWLQYAFGSGHVRLGRQRINLDQQRFIGGVGWRQNEQTFDAVSLKSDLGQRGTWFYAYLNRVNRIFGDDSPVGNHDHRSHLLNYSHRFDDQSAVVAYAYLLDNRNAPAASSDTWGIRYNGSKAWRGGELNYLVELARQSDAANNPVGFNASYWHLRAILGGNKINWQAGIESLQGDADRSGRAFRTPLATLHAFNGWADRFLNTPDAGLRDLYVGASGQLAQWNWRAMLHDFDAEDGPASYGSELDLSASRRFGNHYALLLKLADFEGDAAQFPDTRKFWFMFSLNY